MAGLMPAAKGLSWPFRLLVSMLLGLLPPVAFFGSILLQTDGTEPRDFCIPTERESGLLVLQMNSGGQVPYACELNWSLAMIYILPSAILFGLLVFATWTLVRRR
ncbi:MAG: hypothetical protein ACK4FK_06225 [Ferrovibrio sp.]|uniref:hypothetical protein n=1 Tax=Ferrovibrio sp. TaxID=1917215 RepID=UPI0039193ADB